MTKKLQMGENVIGVLEDQNGNVRTVRGRNIVSNDGDLYYAQVICGETPTDDFAAGGLRLGTGTTAPAKSDTDVETLVSSTAKAETSGYPKTNDTDELNTGAGTDIVTWKFEYAAGDFTGSGIAEGAIVDNTTTPTACLCHWKFSASFAKTASESLVVYVNHTVNGV